jgi:chemotaxis signal transduction protein
MTERAEIKKRLSGKYLTFGLGKEEYGIGILKVREIVGMMTINAVPQLPDSVKGVINLRDKVIPIVDLRTRFQLPKNDYTDRTCIIVVEMQTTAMQKCWEVKQCGKEECPACGNSDNRCWMISGTFCRNEIQGSFHEKIEACRKCDFYKKAHMDKAVSTIGLIVDSVSEVANIRDDNIEAAPAFGNNVDTNYILGMAKSEGNVKILLDIDRVLNSSETNALKRAV